MGFRDTRRFANLQDQHPTHEEENDKHAENNGVATEDPEDVRARVEVVEDRAGDEAGDDACSGGGDVGEAEKATCFIARDDVDREGPVDREKAPSRGADEDTEAEDLRQSARHAEQGRDR